MSAAARSTDPARRSRVVAGAVYTAVCALLAAVAAWPVYASPAFLVVAAVAVPVAAGLVALSSWRRWGGWITAALIAGAFAVLAVPLAVPSRLGGPLEIVRGLGEAFSGVVLAWKDLVTVELPVGDYRNLLVPALVVFLVGTAATLALALRSDRLAPAAVVSGLAMSGFGLFFGRTSTSAPLTAGPVALAAPVETGVGVVAVLSAVLWLAWRTRDERTRALRRASEAGAVRLPRRHSRTDRRRAALGAGMVVVAVVIAVAVVPWAAKDADRRVLRSAAGPERQIAEAVSPLSEYRAMFSDARAEDVLFRVGEGAAAPERIRIATLDVYDGEVFRSSGSGPGAFVRVPSSLPRGDGRSVEADIEIVDLRGIWMPTAGQVVSATFEGERQNVLADRFYYSVDARAGVQIADGGLTVGDRYEIAAVEPTDDDPATFTAPGVDGGVSGGENLRRWVDEHASGDSGADLVALVRLLRERGYLSHGLTPAAGAPAPAWTAELPGYQLQPSASGHSLARIDTMFQRLLEREDDPRAEASGNYVAAVGDDEQFAVAVALIARELGFPSRVVVGTRLASSDPGVATCEAGECRAGDLSAWTEVQGDDGRWAAIDSTPQWELSPSLEVTQQRDPENVTEVRPDTVDEVVPPDPVQEDNGLAEDDRNDDGIDLAWLWPVLRVAGISLLIVLILFGPLLAIVVAKILRRRGRRRDPDPRASIAGGWDEYVDAGVDAGRDLRPSSTRRELAAVLDTPSGMRLADDADRAVFSSRTVTADEASEFWRIVDAERRTLTRQRGWWQRVRAAVSLRSFLRFFAPRPMRRRPPHRDERGKRPPAGRRETR
ncbi:DUF3488 and transglutaminase-like domain-containing protein [Microbacterium testaceum]|uniref:DUF3488 and transglutaminase-like domain-containing protein n=1 Tax=Microbacterium testaceum TaxID=2033 RepID=UPI001D171E00|nr:transglutaminase domain-containing protein [Microbacterium testaceum]MCC4248638.1 transglutaminase-like domain-containing protein [Microbacterium testaceum]